MCNKVYCKYLFCGRWSKCCLFFTLMFIFCSSNEADVFLLVHHLYATLPDRVVIVVKETENETLNARCIQALQREAHFLSHGLQTLLNEHDQKQAAGEADDAAVDDLRTVGEKFKRKQQKLRENEKAKLQVSSDKLRKLQKDLSDIRQTTDLTFTKCLSKK